MQQKHIMFLFVLPLICIALVSGHPFNTREEPNLVKRAGVFPEGVAPNSTDECKAAINKDSWTANSVGDFVVNSAITLQPFTTGLYQTYVNAVPALAIDNKQCTLEISPCNTDFAANCPANPVVMEALSGMDNFANFFKLLNDAIGKEANNIIRTVDAVIATFQPFPTYVNPVTPIKGASFGLTLLSIIAGGVPGIGQIVTSGAAVGLIAGSVLGFVGGAQPVVTGAPDPQFQNAAILESSLNDIQTHIDMGLTMFVDSLLNDIPEATNYDQDMKQLPQILFGGDFAAAIPSIPASVTDSFHAGLVSLAVNQLWSQSQVAIFTFDESDIADASGNKPPPVCSDERVFPAGVKFCDASGRASVLQAIPTNLEDKTFADQTNPTTYTVPGFDKLGDNKLKFEDIIAAASNNQRITNSYQSQGPAPADFATNIEGLNPMDVNLGQTIFSNLPVCDLKQNPPPDAATIENCATQAATDEFKCIFYHRALVGCPGQSVGGKMWPYQTQNNVSDTLNMANVGGVGR